MDRKDTGTTWQEIPLPILGGGITYVRMIAWPEQGCFVEQGFSPEDVGALYAPMFKDGTMDRENVAVIETPWSEV